jgi:hypothetical protein
MTFRLFQSAGSRKHCGVPTRAFPRAYKDLPSGQVEQPSVASGGAADPERADLPVMVGHLGYLRSYKAGS